MHPRFLATPRQGQLNRSPKGLRMSAITFVVAVVTAGTLLTVAASAPVPDTEPGSESLLGLVDLAAQRVYIADAVASAKWGTDAPINDPVREKTVLDGAVTKSIQLAIDPVVSVQVFTDQIEANKAVQYALHSRWSAHPDHAPATRPDLGRVRPVLDQITDGLLIQLKAPRMCVPIVAAPPSWRSPASTLSKRMSLTPCTTTHSVELSPRSAASRAISDGGPATRGGLGDPDRKRESRPARRKGGRSRGANTYSHLWSGTGNRRIRYRAQPSTGRRNQGEKE